MIFYQSDGLGGDKFGGVAIFDERLIVAVPVERAVASMFEIINCAGIAAVLMVEAATCRQIFRGAASEVPFTADGGCRNQPASRPAAGVRSVRGRP